MVALRPPSRLDRSSAIPPASGARREDSGSRFGLIARSSLGSISFGLADRSAQHRRSPPQITTPLNPQRVNHGKMEDTGETSASTSFLDVFPMMADHLGQSTVVIAEQPRTFARFFMRVGLPTPMTKAW
jgi:hypothetical protein